LNCLLTGANGFLGESIKKELSKYNNVLSLSRTSGDYKISLEKEIPDFKDCIDFVIHAAGKAHLVPKNKKENTMYFNVNVQGTQNLLKGIELTGYIPKRFVFISTVAVYGLEKGIDIDENKPLLANDPYGLSKIKAEQLILDWCKKNNVICTILRLPLLVGENPPGNLGEMINGIVKGYYFNIAGGKAKKSMVLAEDVAKILLKASEIGGVYNLTDGLHPNFYDLSNAIGKKFGRSKIFNLPFFIVKGIALFGDVLGAKFPLNSNKLNKINTDLTFDDTKARQVLKWNPSNVIHYYTKKYK
jgi:nucleoside-diphosphate-sugar epimerase